MGLMSKVLNAVKIKTPKEKQETQPKTDAPQVAPMPLQNTYSYTAEDARRYEREVAHRFIDEGKARELLNDAKMYADKVNTTTDPEEFEYSFFRVKECLTELSAYEGKVTFGGISPSENLRSILANEQATRDAFAERVAQKMVGDMTNAMSRALGSKNQEKKPKETPIADAIQKKYEPKPSPSEPTMSAYEIERYAIMCNAYVEHEEEMRNYEGD